MNTLIYRVGFGLIVLLALVFRVAQLDQRVMHNDEANQAVRAGQLLENGTYRYDPVEHHGPTLYYFSLPLAWLSAGTDFTRTTETTYRLVPAILGVITILFLCVLRDGIGRGAVLISAALLAVSPAMVYYSRFFIQEMMLLCFTAGAIAFGWRYSENKTVRHALITGLFLGLMHATKETCIITYFCIGLALVPALFKRVRTDTPLREVGYHPNQAIYLFIAAGVVSATLFSSFITYPKGIANSFATYLGYFDKGLGDTTPEHVHPFGFYLKMLFGQSSGGLFWSEWVIMVLGVVGLAVSVGGERWRSLANRRLTRFIAIYTVSMTLIYSLIPYKTPWCMISFLFGWILLAGIGAMRLYYLCRTKFLRALCVALVVAGTVVLAQQSHKTSFRYGADARNPYAYAHTVSDFLRLVQRIDDVTALQENGNNTPIAVVTNPQDAWPMPWYLKGFPNTGYWNSQDALPATYRPGFIIASLDQEEAISAMANTDYIYEYWGLRDEVLLVLYIHKDLWAPFIASRSQ